MESFGIDVAKWNGTIDWKKVAAVKDFAILKLTKKDNKPEEAFERNYKGASAVNIPLGGYRYVYATTETAAIVEAKGVISALQGRPMPMKIWLDMEDASIKKLGKKKLTQIIDAEARIFRAAGYDVGIYCNRDWFLNVLDTADLKNRYPFWIARYPANDQGEYKSTSSLSPKQYAVAWQYSSKGKVAGIIGNVDLNVLYTTVNTAIDKRETYSQAQFIAEVEAILKANTTAAALAKTPTISASANKSHALVTPLERYMKALGYYSGSIEADEGKTPVFGAKMTEAIKKYQKEVVKASVKNQDGVITAKANTWKKLLATT